MVTDQRREVPSAGERTTSDPASKLSSGSGSASWRHLTASESPRGLDETQANGLHFLSVWFSRTWVGLRICHFDKSPDDADCWSRDHSLTEDRGRPEWFENTYEKMKTMSVENSFEMLDCGRAARGNVLLPAWGPVIGSWFRVFCFCFCVLSKIEIWVW